MGFRVTIYVDPNEPAGDGKTVGHYALRMHEGAYELGPLSRAKAAGGKEVGPKFLTRALNKHRARIIKQVRDALKG